MKAMKGLGAMTEQQIRGMTNEQLEFVRAVRGMCAKNYDNGGDVIIECYSDAEILAEFKTLNEVKSFCGLRLENATNKRWGEDNDPELAALERFGEWS